jgi:hypothetical protein
MAAAFRSITGYRIVAFQKVPELGAFEKSAKNHIGMSLLNLIACLPTAQCRLPNSEKIGERFLRQAQFDSLSANFFRRQQPSTGSQGRIVQFHIAARGVLHELEIENDDFV